jgi:tetratricopeptide (TPR) repeat protein
VSFFVGGVQKMWQKVRVWCNRLIWRLVLGKPGSLEEAQEAEHRSQRDLEEIQHLLAILKQDLSPEALLTALESHLDLYPESNRGRRFYLHKLSDLGRIEEALVLCQEYHRLRPEGQFESVEISLLTDLERYDEALTLCKSLQGTTPLPELENLLWLTRARLLVVQGKPDEALAALQQAQERYPNSPRSPEAFLIEAEAQALSGEQARARRLLKRALWNTPDGDGAPVTEKVVALQQRYGL